MASLQKGARESEGNTPSLSCLNEVIDSNRWPRKAIADEIGKSEATFSKMTSGLQAFGLDDFGNLPRDIQIAWMKRYGKEVLGLTVREIDAAEIAEEFFELVERMGKLAQLSRIVGKPVKAELGEREARRVG